MAFWSKCFYDWKIALNWLMWVFLHQCFLCRLHYFITDHTNKHSAAPGPHPDYVFLLYPTNLFFSHYFHFLSSFPNISFFFSDYLRCSALLWGSLCSYSSQGSKCWLFVSALSILHFPQLPIKHTQRNEGLLFHCGSFPCSCLQTRLPFFNNEDISHSGSSR